MADSPEIEGGQQPRQVENAALEGGVQVEESNQVGGAATADRGPGRWLLKPGPVRGTHMGAVGGEQLVKTLTC